MSGAGALAARLGALTREGRGDPAGLALVGRLLARAGDLSGAGHARLLARAEALLEAYGSREARPAPGPTAGAVEASERAWRAALAARARVRAPRVRSAARATTLVAEIRASAATARAAEQVPEAAGPYHGAAVASRALDALAEVAPGYLGEYVAWLEDLACLADLPARRPAKRGKP